MLEREHQFLLLRAQESQSVCKHNKRLRGGKVVTGTLVQQRRKDNAKVVKEKIDYLKFSISNDMSKICRNIEKEDQEVG